MKKAKKKILTAFCFTDMHNQQSMLDYPTTLRASVKKARDLAIEEFGLADIAIVGGDNISDYPYWNKSCALPKKNFLDIKQKINVCISASVKDGKVLYVAGNNDMILGDIGTPENEPYNSTDFYCEMDESFGILADSDKFTLYAKQKPTERYLGAFHYIVNGIDFIGINIDPNTAYNSHEGYYSNQTLFWVRNKLNEIDTGGTKPVFVIGHLSAVYYYNDGELQETMINGNKALFYDIFKGHKNVFYLYGHVHGERACYKEYTSGAILHIDNDGKPLGRNLKEKSSIEKTYAYSFVHMGGLRPFDAEYFNNDGLTGYGGETKKSYHLKTGTPKLAQYLVFEVYTDKVIFYMRNTGSLDGYTKENKLAEYTVYLAR